MGHLYDNCYKLMEDVRHGVNEWSAALVNGTDTSGKFQNSYLLEKINSSQRHIYNILVKYIEEEFYEDIEIACTNSVVTLPANFGRIVQFEDSQQRKIHVSSIKYTPTQSAPGHKQYYYRKGRTLVRNKTGVTETCKLKYYRRPREIHFGQAQTGGGALALWMENAAGAKPQDDYYNGMTVENFTSQFDSVISDYAKTSYIATTTGTHVDDDYYGLISEIPLEFHFLIAPFAIMQAKAQHPASQELPTRTEVDIWNMEVIDAIRGFAGEDLDVPSEDLWTDFENATGGGPGHNIPDQGYTV